MILIEITLKGFDGGTDTTDHLVKWVAIDPQLIETFKAYCESIGAEYWGELDVVEAATDYTINSIEDFKRTN